MWLVGLLSFDTNVEAKVFVLPVLTCRTRRGRTWSWSTLKEDPESRNSLVYQT
jgi:hypothetical protein